MKEGGRGCLSNSRSEAGSIVLFGDCLGALDSPGSLQPISGIRRTRDTPGVALTSGLAVALLGDAECEPQ